MRIDFDIALREIEKVACGNVKLPFKRCTYAENLDTQKCDVEPVKAEASNWESESYATP